MTQTVILTGLPSRIKAESLVNAAPHGSVMKIKLPSRSTDQNDLMWALISDVSRAKPDGRKHSPEVWKCLFMAGCGHAVQFETGLDGQPFPVGFRSSRLSKAQMTDLIDFIQAYGAEKGVEWSAE